MSRIEQLMAALEQGNQADASLQGLSEEQARANALRGSSHATANTVRGHGSYLGALADVVNQSRGRQIDREIKPQLADARGASALAKTMGQRYETQNQYDMQERKQSNVDQARTDRQGNIADARTDRLAKRNTMDMEHIASGDRATIVADGRGGYFDGQGNAVNISDYVSYDKPSSRSGGGLSGSANKSGLEKLGKRLNTLSPFTNQVRNIDELLAPYAIGGDKEGGDIPGMGAVEGGRGAVGKTYRFFKGTQEGDRIFQGISAFVSDVLRAKGGTAQTLTETRNILMGLGLNETVDEDVVTQHWPKIREAAQRDLARIKQTTHPEVLNTYYSAFAEGEPTEFEEPFLDHTFVAQDADKSAAELMLQRNAGGPTPPAAADPFAGFSIVE